MSSQRSSRKYSNEESDVLLKKVNNSIQKWNEDKDNSDLKTILVFYLSKLQSHASSHYAATQIVDSGLLELFVTIIQHTDTTAKKYVMNIILILFCHRSLMRDQLINGNSVEIFVKELVTISYIRTGCSLFELHSAVCNVLSIFISMCPNAFSSMHTAMKSSVGNEVPYAQILELLENSLRQGKELLVTAILSFLGSCLRESLHSGDLTAELLSFLRDSNCTNILQDVSKSPIQEHDRNEVQLILQALGDGDDWLKWADSKIFSVQRQVENFIAFTGKQNFDELVQEFIGSIFYHQWDEFIEEKKGVLDNINDKIEALEHKENDTSNYHDVFYEMNKWGSNANTYRFYLAVQSRLRIVLYGLCYGCEVVLNNKTIVLEGSHKCNKQDLAIIFGDIERVAENCARQLTAKMASMIFPTGCCSIDDFAETCVRLMLASIVDQCGGDQSERAIVPSLLKDLDIGIVTQSAFAKGFSQLSLKASNGFPLVHNLSRDVGDGHLRKISDSTKELETIRNDVEAQCDTIKYLKTAIKELSNRVKKLKVKKSNS